VNKLTPSQWIAMAIGMLGVFAAGGTQLDLLIGVAASKAVSALCALTSAALAVPLGILTGQGNVLVQASNIKGVEPIKVNALADPSIAKIALDPANPQLDAKPGAEAAVNKLAQQG
jgi:hypothetical protein